MESNPDEALAQAVALLSDPDSDIIPGDLFRQLAERNRALLDQPQEEIKAALARQAILLEAVSVRFMAKAAIAENPDHSAGLSKIGLSAGRSLVQCLGALHQVTKDKPHALNA